MVRIAFKMHLINGFELQYKKRHDEIWPELMSALKNAGICDYSIFWDRYTNILFAVLSTSDTSLLERLPTLQVMQKWWLHMSDIMETHDDNSPISEMLEEVFHLI